MVESSGFYRGRSGRAFRLCAWCALALAGCAGLDAGDSASSQPATPIFNGSAGNSPFGQAGSFGGAGAGGAGAGRAGTGAVGTGGMNGFTGAGGMGSAGTSVPGTGGVPGSGGFGGGAGLGGAGGMGGMGGMGGTGGAGVGGTGMTGGTCGSGTATDGRPTTGPLACIVEEHNAVRAMVQTATPPPPVTWSADLAAYAQQWTDMTCSSPRHRTNPSLNGKPLGENLYAGFGGLSSNAGKQAVDGWAGEVACYTYGPFMRGDKCDMTCTSRMSSDGCGHYTQVVWRASTQIGCGVTTCGMQTEVICNYAPAGNYVGQAPY
jgi:hypothetical protein